MVIRVLEIGIAVVKLAQSAHKIASILGGFEGEIIDAPEYQMKAQMVRVGNIEFELMEPMGQDGLIKNFIRKRGQGLHHIAFQVDDIARTMTELRRQGIKAVNPEPVQTHGMKAAFLQPDNLCGVLFELIEGSPKWVDNQELPSELQKPRPDKGVGAQGLLSIGIMVEDIAGAFEIYSNAFGAHLAQGPIVDGETSGARICRIGNADLVIMPMPQEKDELNPYFSAKRWGLHHIGVKVQDLTRSVEFLKQYKVDFESDISSSVYSGGLIVLNPEQFGGVPILLRDSIPCQRTESKK